MSQESTRGPGRTGYLIGAIIFVLGLVGSGVLIGMFFFGIFGIGDELDRFVAPGTQEVELSDTGRYMVFYEHRSRVDGRSFSTSEGVPNMEFEVYDVERDRNIPIDSTFGDTTYTLRHYSGTAVRQFRIDDPGTYRLSAEYVGGGESPEFVLAYGEGVGRGILTSVGFFLAGGAAFCFVTLLAIVIAGATFFRRLQSQRQQET